jgi:hypothetical protein
MARTAAVRLGPMRSTLPVLAVLAALAAAGCGESDQDKAQKQVCSARSDISKQVDELKGLTLATATVDGVRESVRTITADLRQITAAQKTLSADRRAEVEAATDRFTSSIASIAQGLSADLSLREASSRLRTAAQELGTAYADSLGKIDC